MLLKVFCFHDLVKGFISVLNAVGRNIASDRQLIYIVTEQPYVPIEISSTKRSRLGGPASVVHVDKLTSNWVVYI